MSSSEPQGGAGTGAPSPRVLRRRAAITVAAGLLGLALCEGVVRLGGLEPLPSPSFAGKNFRDLDDPVLLYENLPGAEHTITFVDTPGAAPRRVAGRVNEDGFRGPRIPRSRTGGIPRLACVGDSHTFGWGVADDEPWPAVLARELGPERAEVLNTGVNGYDVEQELLLLERKVLDWEPDLVVWQWFLNDVAMRGQELKESQKPGRLLRWVAPGRGGIAGTLRGLSRAVDLVADRIYRKRVFDLYGSARDVLYGPEEPAWQRAQAALRTARARCEERGVDFVVVLFPFLHVRDGELVGRRARGIVAEFCRAEGIDVLDLEPAFAGIDPAELRVHPLEYHANARAHALAGEAVAAWLLESGRLGDFAR